MSDNLIRCQLQNYEKAFNLSAKNEIFLQNIVLIAFQMKGRCVSSNTPLSTILLHSSFEA